MDRIPSHYDKDNNVHLLKINPNHKDVIFTIEIENCGLEDPLDDLIVNLRNDNQVILPYEFDFVDMVQDNNRPAIASFVLPLDRTDLVPPYTLSIFTENEELSLSEWRVFVSWSSILAV